MRIITEFTAVAMISPFREKEFQDFFAMLHEPQWIDGSIIAVLGNFHEFQLGLIIQGQSQALSSLSKPPARNMINTASFANMTENRGSSLGNAI